MEMKRILIVGAAIALLLVVMMPTVAMAQGADEWSQYQKNAGHTGVMNLDLPATNRVARRTTAIKAIDSSEPVVAGNRAYVYAGVPGTSGEIYCYSLTSGSVIWHTAVEPADAMMMSWSSPAVSAGVVYIGAGSKVQALDGDKGKVLWTKDLATIKAGAQIVNSSPAIDGNRLVIGDYHNGCYYCLDVSQQGKVLWTFSLEASCTAMSTACIEGGKVYVGQGAAFMAPVSPNGKVWCVDEMTGKAVTAWGTGGSYTTVGKLDVGGT